MLLSALKASIGQYVQGKRWYWYAPVWLVGLYAFVVLLQFDPNKQLPFLIIIPQSFDFFLHEMAHIVTAWLPPILTASAGSFSELLLGAILVLLALKQQSYFALLISCLWFMLACQSTGIYMADARAQKLSLVSLGGALSGTDKTTHDWHFVFGQLHILPLDVLIGGVVRVAGAAVGLAGLVVALWALYLMASAQRAVQRAAKEQELQSIVAAHADQSEAVQGPMTNIYPAVSKGPFADQPETPPRQQSAGK